MRPAELAERLLPWFDVHGRHNLPWQQDPTPYRVWISEVMLQQTQVETVKPYFERFMKQFPEVEALAAAPLDEVLRLWAGLGYYARARNMHRAALEIVARHKGRLPASIEDLMALPGIGRSTAGAILALAHGDRQPILDGNVKRVLARVFLIEDAPESTGGARKLWELANACTPGTRVAEYTQSIMDLGATICMRANPACERCPLESGCGARSTDRVSRLPAARRRAPRRLRQSHMLFVLRNGRVLLQRRPPRGIWGGLWAPPEFSDAGAAEAWAIANFAATAEQARRLPMLRHAFTHFDLDIEPWVIEIGGATGEIAEGDARWHELAALPEVGMPAPVARLLKECVNGQDGSVREARPRSRGTRAPAVSG